MSEDEPDPTTPNPPTPADQSGSSEPATDDGLDLARALTRATAGTTPAARRRYKSREGADNSMRRPGRSSGAHPDDRDPQMLDGEVARLIDDRGWALDLRVRGVFARWAELVGDQIATHTTPESFADGRLVVRTSSTAWATQLKLLAPDVVRRLNADLGDGTVTVIEVLGPEGPTWKKGRLSARDGRGPRDTYG
ncbi:DciA family protein [Nocardioides salsibiostraticola]